MRLIAEATTLDGYVAWAALGLAIGALLRRR